MNYFKKSVIGIITLATLIAPSEQVFAAQNISDKAHSSWAKSAITAMAEKDLIPPKLMSQSNFKEDITREEFAELIVTLYEYKNGQLSNYKKGTFNDTSNPYIEKASALGIVAGFPGGIFKPDQKLTRQEMAVMFSTMLNSDKVGDEKVLSKYSDFQEISSWAKHGAYQSTLHNIMTGDSTGRFNPKANLSRQEAISVVNNYLLQGKTPPVITPLPTTTLADIGPILTGQEAIDFFKDTMKNEYPANSVPANPDRVNSFQVVPNGTTVDVQGTQVTGVTLRNDKDKTSEMIVGKININTDKYSGAQYVNMYAHNGTIGIWKKIEITSSGEFATRGVNVNQVKALILWSTTGNGVLLEMN
ncbi:S-layer homology domain-containing protein [Acetoanaerobium noterae]|uniref:S-layer homology domain-containing protein n=1 Tax=Acetoanaerobium noterae TaxID=745369 RepID=UPI0028A5AF27|nr:S-layer homology domain-containing protein [Acetoanaerobium noterae]